MNDFQNTDKAKRMFGNEAPDNAASVNDTQNFKNKKPNPTIPSQGLNEVNQKQKEKQKEAQQKAKERADKARQKVSDTANLATPTIGSKLWLAAKKVGRGATNTVKKTGRLASKAYNSGENANDNLGSDVAFEEFIPSKTVFGIIIGCFLLGFVCTYWEQRFIPDITFNHMDNQMHNEKHLINEATYEETETLTNFQEGYDGKEVLDDFNTTSPLYNGGDAYVNGAEKKDEND